MSDEREKQLDVEVSAVNSAANNLVLMYISIRKKHDEEDIELPWNSNKPNIGTITMEQFIKGDYFS